MIGRHRVTVLASFLGLGLAQAVFSFALAQGGDWVPVTGAETLREFISGLTTERALPGGEVSRAEYRADGTGVLHAWGVTHPRTWNVEGDDRLCVTAERETLCFELERSAATEDLYRVRDVATGEAYEFRVTGGGAVATGPPGEVGSHGGAGAASAAEIAAELSNPNTVMGTLNTQFDYLLYDGSLPGADDQSAVRMTFQPSLPYPLKGGKNLFVRPAIPILIDQPLPGADGSFESKGVELGDIGFDAAFGFTFPKKRGANILIAGVAGAFPTATDDALGLDQWLLGPELGFGVVRQWGVVGIVFSHQWDIAGEDSFNTSVTGGQYFYTFNLKDGWQIIGAPQWSYNHEAGSGDAWTVPVGVGISKTSILGGRPWKMSFQYWNFIEAPEAFATEHQLRFTVGPVVALPWKGRQ